jgi:hypothetical protein
MKPMEVTKNNNLVSQVLNQTLIIKKHDKIVQSILDHEHIVLWS